MNLPFTKLISYLLFSTLIVLGSCRSSQKQKTHQPSSPTIKQKQFILNEPSSGKVFQLHDSILIQLNNPYNNTIDSVAIYTHGVLHRVKKNNTHLFYLQHVLQQTGPQNIRLKIYSDTLVETLLAQVRMLSNIEPKKLQYTLIQKLPHNSENYTQGLFIYNNHLYESTGRNGQSRITKSDADNRKVLLQHELKDQYFGEGITRVNDKIYQLTYQHRVGFVYNLEDFKKLAEFNLQISEGWGLTYDGTDLIMSDGSARLYFYNPENLDQTRELTVADNKGFIRNLNELEYVNGKIWANIYTTNHIVQIDAKSGKVLGKLDLSALFPENTPKDIDHVLNGIAYHPDRGSYFVTGKLWPVMYEIKIK